MESALIKPFTFHFKTIHKAINFLVYLLENEIAIQEFNY